MWNGEKISDRDILKRNIFKNSPNLLNGKKYKYINLNPSVLILEIKSENT